MPYSGTSDPALPKRIQDMPENKRSAFVQAFNSAYETCQKKGGKDCEKRAFAVGNAAANQASEKDMTDQEKQMVSENGSIVDYIPPHLSQVEANYRPYGYSGTKGCATCRWWQPHMQRCHVVDGVIIATGMSDLYLAITPEQEAEEIAEDIEEYTEALDQDGLTDYLSDITKQFDTPSGFKMLDDNLWIGWYTNAYEDREKEFFPEKAIEADIAHMAKTGDYPELRFWHVKGTRHGKAIAVAKIGRFAVAIGEFEDSKLTDAFKAYYTKNTDLGMSHGFKFNPKKYKRGAYHEFHTFEISVLPLESAANIYTSFSLEQGKKEMAVKFTEAQKAALVKIIGKDETDKLIQQGEKQTEELDKQGIAYKDTSELLEEAEKAEMEMQEEDDMKTLFKKFVKLYEGHRKEDSKRIEAMEKRFMPPEEKPEEKKDVNKDKSRSEQNDFMTSDRIIQILADRVINGNPGEKEKAIENRTPADSLLNAFFGKD